VQYGRAGAELVRGEHRLGVLLLVLHDHSEGEALLHQPPAAQRAGGERVERLLADLRHVGAGLGGPSSGSSTGWPAECWKAS
jgi:hypothetical protein